LLLGQHVKVADFGLAKLLEKATLQQATQIGTPAYMAPEVWNGQVGPHSDQYSLAVMYAELRTGRFPFTHECLPALMYAHLHKEPELAPLGPHEQRALRQALAKEPRRRFPTCTDFVRALAEALREGTAVIEPGRRRPKPAPPTLPPPFSLTLPIRQPNRRPAPRPAPQRRWLLGAALLLGVFGLVGLVLLGSALSAPDQHRGR